jgi:hypothetical protein
VHIDHDIHNLPELVHGFRADDWQACWNMHLRGTLGSVDLLNEVEFGGPSLREMSIEDLRAGAFRGLPIALSRRMTSLALAASIRAGGQVGVGAPPYPTHVAPNEAAERIVAAADRELVLEQGRRKLAPEAPSRLGCLWLAEDTPAGRTMVSRIKGQDAFVMRVEVSVCARLRRLDARWLSDELDENAVAGYWSGRARGGQPLWEYLLDGVIRCADPEELERLNDWAPKAATRASGTQGSVGTPRD